MVSPKDVARIVTGKSAYRKGGILTLAQGFAVGADVVGTACAADRLRLACREGTAQEVVTRALLDPGIIAVVLKLQRGLSGRDYRVQLDLLTIR